MMSITVSREIVSLQGDLEAVNSRPHHMIAENSNDHGVHQAWRKGLIQWERPAKRLVLPVEREEEEMSAITTFFNSKTMFIHLPPRVFEKHRPQLFLSFFNSLSVPEERLSIFIKVHSTCLMHALLLLLDSDWIKHGIRIAPFVFATLAIQAAALANGVFLLFWQIPDDGC